MLYLAIDQLAKQLTICVRDEEGGTVLRRQVSTQPEKVEAFFEQLIAMDAEFTAILEVCGFNDWLLKELQERGCREIVLIHPEKHSKQKTDRRDAQKLADLQWLDRDRLAAGQTVRRLRHVYLVTDEEREDRQLTTLRKSLRAASVLDRCDRASFSTQKLVNPSPTDSEHLRQMMRLALAAVESRYHPLTQGHREYFHAKVSFRRTSRAKSELCRLHQLRNCSKPARGRFSLFFDFPLLSVIFRRLST